MDLSEFQFKKNNNRSQNPDNNNNPIKKKQLSNSSINLSMNHFRQKQKTSKTIKDRIVQSYSDLESDDFNYKPKQNKKTKKQTKGSQNNLFQSTQYDFRKDIKLKEDYKSRPLIVSADNKIFLDSDNKLYRIAYEFLISIADPIHRPTLMHYYKLTKYSLYTAMVLQYDPDDIIDLLEKLSKNLYLPDSTKEFIKDNTKNYGSCRMFLYNEYYYLDITEEVYEEVVAETQKISEILQEVDIQDHEQILFQNKELAALQNDVQKMVQEEEIQNTQNTQQQNQTHKIQYDQFSIQSSSSSNNNSDSEEEIDQEIQENKMQLEKDLQNLKKHEKQKKNKKKFKRFQINGNHFLVTEHIIKNNVPLIQEYDFDKQEELDKKEGKIIETLTIKPLRRTRFYQERALKNIFIENKARSGLIILPCGAGKTVVGIVAVSRIKRNTIIICDSDVSVDQWRDELERWTQIKRNQIVRLTGKIQDKWEDLTKPCILITTYYMLAKKRDSENPIVLKMKSIKEWNACIIDEVHKLPAQTFQNLLKQYKFHFKLGLTATPYREDDKIHNLFYMIGPKLYEENWQDLVNQGFLAKPYCIELRCQMSSIFEKEYEGKKGHSRELIHTSNPTKFKALQYLIKVHEERGDKILVFCDRPKVIEEYSEKLKYPCIHGKITQDERKKIFNYFKTSNQINTIFLSRVGDTAIDLPAANVGIQIGVHFGSRRQEVQRLGRIMRAKDNPSGDYNAFWYTLISQNTDETVYCWGRQKCLIDQGFKYEIVNEQDLPYNQEPEKFKWIKSLDEKEYLFEILFQTEQQNMLNNNKKGKNTKKQQQQMEESSSSSSESDSGSESQLYNVKSKQGFNNTEGDFQYYLDYGKKQDIQKK